MYNAIVRVIVLLSVSCLAVCGKMVIAGPTLAKLDLKDPLIQSTRGTSKGTLIVAQHFGLSPKWLDPQEQGPGTITHAFVALVHDAPIKPTRQGYYTYSLAEHLEMPADYTYAKFRLRLGLTFHDGPPLTTADVKWSYENYRGLHAATLHGKPGEGPSGWRHRDRRRAHDYFPLQRTVSSIFWSFGIPE